VAAFAIRWIFKLFTLFLFIFPLWCDEICFVAWKSTIVRRYFWVIGWTGDLGSILENREGQKAHDLQEDAKFKVEPTRKCETNQRSNKPLGKQYKKKLRPKRGKYGAQLLKTWNSRLKVKLPSSPPAIHLPHWSLNV